MDEQNFDHALVEPNQDGSTSAWSGDNNGLPILTDNFAGSFDHLQEAHWPDLAMFPAIGSGLDVPNIDSHPSWLTQDPVGHQSIVAEMLQAESICPCYPGYQNALATIPATFGILQSSNCVTAGEQIHAQPDSLFDFYFPTTMEQNANSLAQNDNQTRNDPLIATFPALTSSVASTASEAALHVDTIIGTIRLNGDIMCHHTSCRRPYGRLAELKRHYATAHAEQKAEYWCNEPLCERSMAGGRPFHRKDKFREHGRKVHGRVVYRRRG